MENTMGDLSMGEQPSEMGELGQDMLQRSEEWQDQESVLFLKKPLRIDGQMIERLEFDFDELSARDLHEASKYLKKLGIPISVPALDYEYQLIVFAKAVKRKMPEVELFDLMRLSAGDSMKATGFARDFLLNMDPGQKELGSDE